MIFFQCILRNTIVQLIFQQVEPAQLTTIKCEFSNILQQGLREKY